MNKKNYSAIKKIFLYTILSIYGLITVLPLLWMGIISLKTSDEIFLKPFALPETLHFENYTKAWKLVNIGELMGNSIFVTTVATLIAILVSILASYALARIKFKLKFHIYIFFLFGIMIPVYTVMFPVFMLNKMLNLGDTYIALIGPYIAFSIPINILILVGFMKNIPTAIEESAFLDGAGLWKILISIVIPILKPAIATVAILNFLNNWNEFVLSLVLISKSTMKTLPVGIASIAGQYTSNYEIMAAGLMFAVVPVMLFYIILQKYIVEGMTAGAVKG